VASPVSEQLYLGQYIGLATDHHAENHSWATAKQNMAASFYTYTAV